ncbi:uncharacterized protein TNCV_2187391 [Trichonephila clavipes]|nr:uncharacterized protein TNCV_2187391 [Trichonephila clavipes]
MVRHYMRERGLVMGRIGRTRENPKDLGKPRVRRDNSEQRKHSAAERRPVLSRQATAVRPCPYYLRSRFNKPEGTPEEQSSNGIDSLPQNNLKRISLSMEALDGDPEDRSK